MHPLRASGLAVRWREPLPWGGNDPRTIRFRLSWNGNWGETVIPIALEGLTGVAHLMAMTGEAPASFMDALPDPMKLDPYQIGFVIVLMTGLYIFLKFTFFQPVTQVMDEREAAIAAGGAAKADASAQVELRQAEYAARLRELRGKAFEHRKALADAAAQERVTLLESTRQQASESRNSALAELKTQGEAAKAQLVAQVDALSESMVQHLLKQA